MKLIVNASIAILLALSAGLALARDDGRYANSPLKPWFDTLKSGKGLCCSNADGVTVSDPDWDSKDGHYRVRLEANGFDVPDEAVHQGTQPCRTHDGRAYSRCDGDVHPMLPAGNHELRLEKRA
jgi:hypothetical protein